MEKYYSIGDVSKLTGATVKTIRYYDEIGLLPASKISSAGYRYYLQDDIWQLELILFLRYLGFKISEIKQILHNERPASVLIQWQIEAIQHQVDHLERIKQILIQANEQKHQHTPLAYLQDIAAIMAKNDRQRQEFIAEKLQDAFVDQYLPDDWRQQMLEAYIGFVPQQQDLTERQLDAWSKINALLDNPSFVQEIRQKLNPFWQAVQEQQLEASPWGIKYKQITDTIIGLIEKGETESSLSMQKAAIDYVSLFLNTDTPIELDTLQLFLSNAESMTSDRLKEWWDLILVLNPSLEPYARSQQMIKDTIEWLVSHPEHLS